MILKIVFIAIICIFISSLLKKYNSEFSSIVSVCGGVIIFLLSVDEITNIVNQFSEIYNFTELNFDFLSIVFKVLGVGYITEFTADIAEDFGNHVIASKVVLGGKVVICGMTLAVVKKLLSLLLSLLSWPVLRLTIHMIQI